MEFLAENLVGFGDLTAGKENIAKNFINWTSGDETIDSFIQKKQLQYNGNEAVFEWIPYNELINIKEIENNWLTTAIWKKGPLFYDKDEKEWIRGSYEKVILRFLYNLQDITDEFTNKVESYLLQFSYGKYGISQNPDTEVYILVFDNHYFHSYCKKCGEKYEHSYSWCKTCILNHLKNNFTNWTSGNEKIDEVIQKRQSKISNYEDTVLEWIPYNELIYIKEVEGSDFAVAVWTEGPLSYSFDEVRYIRKSRENVYLKQLHNPQEITDDEVESLTHVEWIPYNELVAIKEIGDDILPTATWTEGPLSYDSDYRKFVRESYETVILKHLYNLQDITEEFLNEVESYLTHDCHGISQNPDTKVYILILKYNYFEKYCEKCGNEYDKLKSKYIKWCKQCQINNLKNNFTNWTSGNEKIDDFIHKMQLKINKHDDIIFEWIPYKFFDIKENIECGSAIAMWKNGPLIYKEGEGMINESHKKVGLRYLHNLQDINNEFLNEVESYLTKKQVFGISQNPDTKIYILVFDVEYFRFYCEKCNNKYENRWSIWKDGPLYYSKMRGEYRRDLNKKVLLKHLYNSENVNYIILNEIVNSIKEGYGISQYPNTKDFILVLQLKYYCVNCGKKYSNKFEIDNKSCTLCQINHENKKISDLIHEMEINIDYNYESNMKFEWIPYDQFNNIEEIGKGGFSTVYSATWKDGLLEYNSRQGWNRISNTKVALKCIYNSQNCLDKFINEVKVYSKQKINNILKIYGISQDPITKDYIMVLEYAVGGNFNSYLEKNYENLNWAKRIDILNNIIEGLDRIHQKHMVHRDFHCWDSNSDNRPKSNEVKESIELYYNSLHYCWNEERYNIRDQFKKLPCSKAKQLTNNTQAIYTSRLLNPFTKNLSKYSVDNNTVEVTDFTMLYD
ncbi:kinase-like domain-containing protein [Rhizophagus clarus]|uniref:Kinase-like domain-containing protein n=1 Tax=Rhizophagus clarus TaxID=94130 RepID=A0A8H3M274_9GLOM|nr:kinase-like domain-containing protein [Rhizophagus clarus]